MSLFLIVHMISIYVLFGIPIAIMFARSGASWAFSLFVLLPIIGLPIALLLLANRPWRREVA
ncbi:MAG: hypothetical protein AAF563_02475 [Pseudomonadota bacterium]